MNMNSPCIRMIFEPAIGSKVGNERLASRTSFRGAELAATGKPLMKLDAAADA